MSPPVIVLRAVPSPTAIMMPIDHRTQGVPSSAEAQPLAGPTMSDEHFVELVKAQMQDSGCYSRDERAAAKFMVRGLKD